ncbi:MAG: hypothetical protein JNN04_13685 [Cyclobacteriaceae bacterium]|nr:hypothetical protein [Cyclobacteriaceae bacterium]
MKRVLVCVLDWGLGHATRSVPVIRELQRQGADVVLASSGAAGKLLRQEFPQLNYHELPGYGPTYQRNGSIIGAMAAQLFKFARTIRMEHLEVETLVRNLRVDRVISDNRYGCYSTRVPSVLITHQYHIQLAPRWSGLAFFVNRWLEFRYRKFRDVWNPDQRGSGLTEPFVPPRAKVDYVGWLSRFGHESPDTNGYPIVAVVSGPEPQRKIFADQLRQELIASGRRALLVTGQPGEEQRHQEGNLKICSHLPAKEMERALRGAGLIIARSGYSTLMDLIALGRNAVLVPTPQQPEQEFLARRLQEMQVAFCPDQQNFVLETAMKEAGAFRGLSHFTKEDGLLEAAIRKLLS